MFIIDKLKNEVLPLTRKTFHDLDFKERNHLQEWISKNTDILGERLLIIQKEFSEFDETRERLDLLAIDENGSLVIIENKLDDSGRDVVWQALKYVSYCSGLTQNDIKEIYQKYLDLQGENKQAEKEICDFLEIEDFSDVELNSEDQRIILVAANFRREVTSTVMWLLDHNIKIKCIKITPYELEGKILLGSEQIIPIIEAEHYLVKRATKKQEELITREEKQNRYTVRLAFWAELLRVMNEKSDLFRNVNPSKDNWLGCGSGYSGSVYTFVITGKYARVELWINRGMQEENKKIFDNLYSEKEKVEALFGAELDWQRRDEGKGSRIAYWLKGVNAFNKEDWPEMIDFLTNNMIRFENSMRDTLKKTMLK